MLALLSWHAKPWIGWIAGATALAAAFLARYHLTEAMGGLPFVTFFLAVILTSLLGGWKPATAVAAASLLLAIYFFLGPQPGWHLRWPDGYVAAGFFLLVSGSQILLVHVLMDAVRRLDAKRQQIEALRQSEKLMFSELQHRVANGIQLVASLLSIEAGRIETAEDAAGALDEAVSRLSMVATVHRRLHDPRVCELGLEGAFAKLAREILKAAGREDVVVSVSAPQDTVSPADATSLAMILAEAVTNAVKHAFARRPNGRLDIRSTTDAAGVRTFVIRDDGPGFRGLEVEDEENLGLLVMRSMAQRLGGRLEVGDAPEGGAQVAVIIPPR